MLKVTLAHCQDEVVRDPADWVVQKSTNLPVKPPIGELEKELENLRRSPHVKKGLRGVSRDGYISHRKPSKLARVSTEVERPVIGGDVAPDCIHAHHILEGRRGPLPLKQQRAGDLQIRRLALVEDLDERFVGSLIKAARQVNPNLFIKFTERFEDLEPIQVGVVLSEGT